MQCSQIKPMLANYALGDTRVTEKLCVEVHIVHCDTCRRELEDFCELIHASDKVLSHPKPRDDFDGLMARIAAEEAACVQTPISVRVRWQGLLVRTAAAVAIVVVVAGAAPWIRQTGRAMREVREATTGQPEIGGKSVRVPVVTESFVKRASDIQFGEASDPLKAASTTLAPPLAHLP